MAKVAPSPHILGSMPVFQLKHPGFLPTPMLDLAKTNYDIIEMKYVANA
jgi:hypothetical protein